MSDSCVSKFGRNLEKLILRRKQKLEDVLYDSYLYKNDCHIKRS